MPLWRSLSLPLTLPDLTPEVRMLTEGHRRLQKTGLHGDYRMHNQISLQWESSLPPADLDFMQRSTQLSIFLPLLLSMKNKFQHC